MPRSPDSAQLDLAGVFQRIQRKMLADLTIARLFEHPSAAGTATEHHWLHLFEQYLPTRYRSAPAFIMNSSGRRSRQIDIAIFDTLHFPPLFPHTSGTHIPIESVYAVFEVKPTISRQWLRDAGQKAASVRILSPTKRKILAGLLATSSVWRPSSFSANLRRALTANDGALGEQHLRDFQDNEKSIPTILTTSQKLSTGVDARHILNIVLMRPIHSLIEFKQIIGRGTRLYDGKDYFTIYDFVRAHHHFADPEWDGQPVAPNQNQNLALSRCHPSNQEKPASAPAKSK